MSENPNTNIIGRVIGFASRSFGGTRPRIVATQFGPLPGGAPIKKKSTKTGGRAGRNNRDVLTVIQSPFEQTLIQRYRDYREADESFPELVRARAVLIDSVFGASGESFIVDMTNARPETRRVIDTVRSQLALDEWIKRFIDEGKWLGDAYAKLILDDDPMRLTGLQSFAPERVRPMVDGDSELLTHYEIFKRTNAVLESEHVDLFKMLHYAPQRPLGVHHGRSIMHSVRGLIRRHEAIDDVTITLVLRKASGQLYFMTPFPQGMDDADVQDQIDNAIDSLDRDVSFDSSGNLSRHAATQLDSVPNIWPYRFIEGVDTKPEIFESRPANLERLIVSLQHYQERAVIGTGVPPALVGIERNVNARATLEMQASYFSTTTRNAQNDASAILTAIIWRALFVEGIIAEPGEFEIQMPEPSNFDESLNAETDERKARAAKALFDAEFTHEEILDRIYDEAPAASKEGVFDLLQRVGQ